MALRVTQLLQDIQQVVGCHYLSDLRQTSRAELGEITKKALFAIPDDAYTVEEWAQAISYLTGKDKTDVSIEEMKDLF